MLHAAGEPVSIIGQSRLRHTGSPPYHALNSLCNFRIPNASM